MSAVDPARNVLQRPKRMARFDSRKAILLSLFVSSVTRAEPAAPPSRAMSLAEAMAYAKIHQPAMRVAAARIAALETATRIPGAQWLPRFGATAQIFAATANQTTASYLSTRSPDLPRIGGTRAVSNGTFQLYASTLVGIGGSQELFDFGRIATRTAAADALVAAERARAGAAALDVSFDVEEGYFAVLAAKSIVQASDDAYERARAHRDLAKAGVGSGLRNPIELTRAESELVRADIGRTRAAGNLSTAQTMFAAVVGVPDAALDTSSAPPEPVSEIPPLGEALRMAAASDPHLREAVAELTAEEATTRAIGAELRPDLSLSATFSARAGGAPPSGNGEPVDGKGFLPEVANWDIGAVFTWPLYDGVVTARRDASRAQEQVRREEIARIRREQAAAVRQSYETVRIAKVTVPGLERAVVAARANYDQADARFRAGLGTSVELADAEALRTEADIELALGRFELARARAALGRSIAEGLRDGRRNPGSR